MNIFRVDGIARQIAMGFNTFFSKERLQAAAINDERMRVARELHDGVLQSLTGAVLQLEALARLVDDDPRAAAERIREIEKSIAEEQRDLRCGVRELAQPIDPRAETTAGELLAMLRDHCRRVVGPSGLAVRLTVSGDGTVPRALGDEIHRLVQEAVSNAMRHARAELCRVDVEIPLAGRVHILVADDGCGFPFHGRYDLASLARLRGGPGSLRERVASLRGTLFLDSTPAGSRIDIGLPVHRGGPRGTLHA